MPDIEGGAPVVEESKPYRQAEMKDELAEPTSLLEQARKGDEERKKVARRILKWWSDQDRVYRKYREEWRVNKARRRGIHNVKLIKNDQNVHEYTIYAPPNVNTMPQTLNKADRLCRRVANFLFTDPPMPEAVPSRDDDEARDAALTTTRILQTLTSEGAIDDMRTMRRAFDLGSTYDSGWRHHFVDPAGGGQRPITVQVHPEANLLQQAIPEPTHPQTGEPYPGPYVTKFVTMGGELVNERRHPQLRMRFLPSIRSEVLTGANVRLLPAHAHDVWEAEGVLIGSFQPLGRLRALYSEIQKLYDSDEGKERLQSLIAEPPVHTEQLLPKHQQTHLKTQELNDDAMVFTLTHYRKQGPTEEHGVFAVVLGKDFLAHIQEWEDPNTGEAMDLPVDQFKQLEDEDSPHGRGLMRQLGGGNELLGMGFEAVITHMQRLKNRRVFIPTNSIIQPRQLQSPTATAIPMNPGGKPEYEEVPTLPNQYFEFINTVANEMNDESALQETAQGVNPPSVQSGLHARQIIEQSIVALSDLRDNTERAIIRGYRLYTQLARAFFTVEQDLNYVGEDGQHRVERWSGASFGDTEDVRIARGSFTQLSPPSKAAEAERFFLMRDPTTGEGIIDIHELRHAIFGNVGGLLGLQDNPHRNRVQRQIQVWHEGPPEEYLQAFAQRQQLQQVVQEVVARAQSGQADPQKAQAFVQQAQQLLSQPLPGDAFPPLPVDEEPAVAVMRHWHLARLLSGSKFAKQPPEWQRTAIEAYERARQAAGILTIAEQQQAAQAQAEAEQQAQEAERQARLQEKQTDASEQVAVADREVERQRVESEGEVLAAQAQARPQTALSVDLTI